MDPVLDGLLDACAAADDWDDTPWLVLADWYDEQGDPHGELIRLSRRGAVTGPADRDAIAAWLAAYPESPANPGERDWPGRLDRGVRRWLLMPDSTETSPPPNPIWPTRLQVDLSSQLLWEWSRLEPTWLESTRLKLVLSISHNYSYGLPSFLASRPTFEGLRFSFPEPQMLMSMRPFDNTPQLHRLSLSRVERVGAAVQGHLEAADLRQLELDSFETSPDPIWANLPRWTALRALRLSNVPFPAAVDFSSLPLRQLQAFGVSAPPLLAMLPAWPELRCLSLHRVPEAPAAHLPTWLRPPQLEGLYLSDCPARFAQATARQLPEIPNLRLLTLSGLPGLADAHLAPLAGCRALESVTLSDCRRLTDATLRTLAGVSTLRELAVRDCPRVTRQGLREFQRRRPECRCTP